ncbi:MAG: hypothetical protein KAG92_05150, partial [Deltaproteobacteria bacterium]|nr:hypothetical protein [Deltaproteobacteria bacterium]
FCSSITARRLMQVDRTLLSTSNAIASLRASRSAYQLRWSRLRCSRLNSDRWKSELIMIKKVYNFKASPIKSGIFLGLTIALALLVGFLMFSAWMIFEEKLSGGTGGAGGIIGFLLAPIIMFTGAPWSFYALEALSNNINAFVIVVSAGVLLNGSILGLIIGVISKLRNRAKNSNN